MKFLFVDNLMNVEIYAYEEYEDTLTYFYPTPFDSQKPFNDLLSSVKMSRSEAMALTTSDNTRPPYFLKLYKPFADLLFKAISDQMSQQGYTPKMESEDKGRLAQMQLHLEDMRSIVRHTLKMGNDTIVGTIVKQNRQ